MKSLSTPVLVIMLAILIACAWILIGRPQGAASQSSSTPITGYLWSDNIGWISLSGSNYGLTIESNNTLSGYAWSDTIGWISANSSDLTGCPSSPCTARKNGNALNGWLKALAAGGGWDGFISLSGSSPAYGVSITNGVFSGYAWGSDVVGWVDFQYASALAPSCTLTANPTSIVQGNTATLSWTSTNSTSGSISPGNITATPVAAGSTGVQPSSTQTYTATFNGSGGSAQCTANITVQCAPVYSCNGANIRYTDASCNTSTVATCTGASYCQAGQSTCQWPEIGFNPNPGLSLSGHLQARPGIVSEGDTTKLYWDVTNAASCTVSGGGQNWSGLGSGSSGVTTNAINALTTYTLSCTGLGSNPSIQESVDVLVVPDFSET